MAARTADNNLQVLFWRQYLKRHRKESVTQPAVCSFLLSDLCLSVPWLVKYGLEGACHKGLLPETKSRGEFSPRCKRLWQLREERWEVTGRVSCQSSLRRVQILFSLPLILVVWYSTNYFCFQLLSYLREREQVSERETEILPAARAGPY